MGYYDDLYRTGRNICGEPFQDFITFFDNYEKENARVLDLGCGQGRDVLFIARKGHRVVGVDLAPTGIEQMLADAKAENLSIEGVVADIVTFNPDGNFDVILLDRVLHMLEGDGEKTAVLEKATRHTKTGGFILIAEPSKQKKLMHDFFAERTDQWQKVKAKKNILFMQKTTPNPVNLVNPV
jgi:2-polyprenyl-3-methyl-5-hydroxy-6-metoxy-1,4-benzoquinol methylase